jgi:hypothetical protein
MHAMQHARGGALWQAGHHCVSGAAGQPDVSGMSVSSGYAMPVMTLTCLTISLATARCLCMVGKAAAFLH